MLRYVTSLMKTLIASCYSRTVIQVRPVMSRDREPSVRTQERHQWAVTAQDLGIVYPTPYAKRASAGSFVIPPMRFTLNVSLSWHNALQLDKAQDTATSKTRRAMFPYDGELLNCRLLHFLCDYI